MAAKSLIPGKFYRYIKRTGPILVQLIRLGEDGLWRARNLVSDRELIIEKPRVLADASYSHEGFNFVDTMIRYKVIYRPVGHKNKTHQLQYGNDVLDLNIAKELARQCAKERKNETVSVVATTWFMAGFEKIWRVMYDDEKTCREMELIDEEEFIDEKEEAELRRNYLWRRRRYNEKGEEIEFKNEDREGEEEENK